MRASRSASGCAACTVALRRSIGTTPLRAATSATLPRTMSAVSSSTPRPMRSPLASVARMHAAKAAACNDMLVHEHAGADEAQPRAQALERAEHYLQRVGLHHRRVNCPAHLSGSDQQRAAIARALVMEPEVMLFDEPTSALDPELVGEVLGVMRQIALDGRTILVVTHEVGFARDVSSEVVFLHQGGIEEQGAPEDVLTRPDSERLRKFLASALR